MDDAPGAAGGLLGQVDSATIRGLVVDPQGRAVVGAKVTLRAPNDNVRREISVTQDGTFAFSALPPGVYEIDVEAEGFKKGIQSDVPAQVSTMTDLRIEMQLGSVTETISVTALVDPLQTADATIGNMAFRRLTL